MLSTTLVQGLERYRIGPKLRALRLKRKMGLVELASHTGLSAAMLSKIERGRLFPTLPTLLRIAMVFSVGLDHFFVDDMLAPLVEVVRKKDRIRLPARGQRPAAYAFESLDFPATNRPINSYYVVFAPGASEATAPHAHQGVELIYVIDGKVDVIFGEDETYTLAGGDSVYFDSSRSHAYRRAGRRPCSAVVVTTAAAP